MRRFALVLLAASSLIGAIPTSAEEPAPVAPVADAAPMDLATAIAQAQTLRSQGDYKGAVHVLAQLMLVVPDDPRVVGEYGKALVQMGRSQDAVAFLTRAVELNPGDWTLFSALGVAEDQLGDRPIAAKAYRKALALKPGEPTVLNNLALNMMLQGHLAEADTLLKQAAAQDASNARIAENLKNVAEMRGTSAGAASMTPQSEAEVPAVVTTPVQEQALPPSALAAVSAPLPAPVQLTGVQPLLAAAERQAGGAVIMQKVPFDPLAGKHYAVRRSRAPHLAIRQARPFHHMAAVTRNPVQHLALADTPAQPDPIPALRTAADIW